jgi:dTDP-4-dehydrorhamnose 3,5-epimerase
LNVERLAIPDVLLFKPRIFRDARGHFLETWHHDRYVEAGIAAPFVQDNVSVSVAGVLRGLHYQQPKSQGKLVSVLQGTVFDVAVDVRRNSPTFGRWVGEELSGENGWQLYVPPGFAHGFVVLSSSAIFAYKCTDYYMVGAERSILWNDPDIGIAWPVTDPVLSDKDAAAARLSDLPDAALPAL